MLKRTITILALFSIALMVFFGCGKEDNPFDPNAGGYNGTALENLSFVAALNPGDGGTIQDIDPSTSDVEGEIIVYFEDFMDASTVTTSNIIVKDTTNNTSITGATLNYYPEIKKAVFGGTFSNDAAIVITLTTGLRNSAGVALDGNENGLIDGSPYDDYRYRVRTGTAFLDTFDFIHPEINGVMPGIENGVDLLPAIIVGFSGSDIDTTKLVLTNFTLVKTSSQVAVTCSLIVSTTGGIMFIPKDSLDEAEEYTVTVRCANIKDESGNVCLGMVGKNMGWIANIPDYTWDFITIAVDPDKDGTPPTVTSANVSGEELVVKFNDDMDTSTFTTTNIRIYNNFTGQNLVGSIINELDGKGFRYTLENAEGGTTYRLWLSKDIKEAVPGGWYFDGNENGVGGEIDDDYETTFTP